MTDTRQLLLTHHLKAINLPTFWCEYEKLSRQCAAEGLDHVRFLPGLVELELIDRERRIMRRRARLVVEENAVDDRDERAWPASLCARNPSAR